MEPKVWMFQCLIFRSQLKFSTWYLLKITLWYLKIEISTYVGLHFQSSHFDDAPLTDLPPTPIKPNLWTTNNTTTTLSRAHEIKTPSNSQATKHISCCWAQPTILRHNALICFWTVEIHRKSWSHLRFARFILSASNRISTTGSLHFLIHLLYTNEINNINHDSIHCLPGTYHRSPIAV
jgi:hypothetical protein